MRRVHGSARGQVSIDLALSAAQHARSRLKPVRLAGPSAIRANKATWPAQLFQIIGAGGIRWEYLLKLRKASGEAAWVHTQKKLLLRGPFGAFVVRRQVSLGEPWENNMKAPEHESPEIVRKAIAAIKQQKNEAQSHLETLKLLRLNSHQQFAKEKAAYLAHIGQMDKFIADAERKCEEAEATLLTLERMASQMEGGG